MRFLGTLLAAGLVFASETHPPSVSLNLPPNGGAIGDWTLRITAEASDDSGVSQVEFFVDGVSLGTATSSPYGVDWEGQTAATGDHTVTAVATDVHGNTATSSPAIITVDRGLPTVAITSPTSGATLSGIIPLRVDTTDDTRIDWVSYYLDGKWLKSLSTPPFSLDWDSTAEADGPHTLTATARDPMGNLSTSTVTVNTQQPVSAEYDPYLQVPLCASLAPFCDTTNRVRSSDHWEPHRPNTLRSSCTDGSIAYAENHVKRLKVSNVSGAPLATGERVRIDAYVGLERVFSYVDLFIASNANEPSWTLLATFEPQDQWGPQVFSAEYVLPAGKLQAVRAQLRSGYGNTPTPCSVGSHNDRDDVAFAVESPPVVKLRSPSNGSRIDGRITLSATVDFFHPVTKVEFYDGTTLLGTDTSEPYDMVWDTASGPNGSVTLTTRAYDAAGNVTVSAGRTVSVDNSAPGVSITSPANGASLALSTTVQATASDNVGVTQVVFYDGATVLGTDTTAPYSVSWNLLFAPKGTHTLTARAYDALGNLTVSAPVSVTVR